MQMNRYIFFALCAVLLIGYSPSLPAQCARTSHDVARRFLDLDFSGYRLSSEGHTAIWDLTEQNGEPPDMPVFVTKEYKILSEKLLPNGVCSFGVHFTTYGHISKTDDGLQFQADRSPEQAWEIQVKCGGETCRINLDFDHFKMPPHPGKRAVDEWLDSLEKIQKTTDGAKRISILRSRIASLR